MSRHIYTYDSILDLKNQPYYSIIKDLPHITATANLKIAIERPEKFNPLLVKSFSKVFDIHEIQSHLFGNWEGATLGQYISVSSVVRDMNLPSSLKHIGEACLKSKKEVYRSIRSLVEADIYPNDICSELDDIKLFCAIWDKVEEIDPSFGEFRALLDRFYSDSTFFLNKLTEYSADLNCKAIVLHGFYYISPLQERIFNLLEKQGIDLLFLCCIDKSLPEIEKVWEKSFANLSIYPTKNEWNYGRMCSGRNYEFGTMFSGLAETHPIDNISIIKYKNEAAFVADIKRIDAEGYTIFSTDSSKTKEILKEIFPEKYKKRHLLAYPIGQYLYTLHSMWDSKIQNIRMSFDDLQNCFSSGWVMFEGKNGRDYTHILELVRPYFSNCDDISDWRERIKSLQNTSEKMRGFFEQHVNNQPQDNQRWHRIMGNPFLNFGCFSLLEKDMLIIVGLINSIIQTANELFGDKSEINIAEHFEKLSNLIHKGEEREIYREETAIINEITERMKNHRLRISTCLPEDISEAVMLIIGGGILDEDSFEVQASSGEFYDRSLFQIETAPIISKGKVHLCLADENRLPYNEKKFSWPLSKDFLKQLADSLGDERAQYIRDFIFINEGSKDASRYLFYQALQNEKVEISWVAEDDGKTIAESPYIRLLCSVFGCGISYKSREFGEVKTINNIKKPVDLTIDFSKLAICEEQLDALICPWKYVYGYITHLFPTYSSDFQYRFVLAALIGSISKHAGIPIRVVADNVLDCFPYLSEVEKRQIKDYSTTLIPIDGTDSLDDVSYAKVRLFPHLASKDLLTRAMAKVDENQGAPVKVDLSFYNGKTYGDCLFCQFNNECIHAMRERGDEQ